MTIIRGRYFPPREIVPTGRTIGHWPFIETDQGFIHKETGEAYEAVSLECALIDREDEVGDE